MGDTNASDMDASTRVSDAKLTSRFVFKHSLGAGGMGEVYLAEDTSLRRSVAIKTIRPDLSRDPEVLKRIERECLLHAKVGPHPHIVTLYDKLEEGGRLNLVMEYVEGETLQQYLERNQKAGTVPSLAEALGIATQVLDALSRIHAHGIVHRDIKPANIILVKDDSGGICAKLMDFGIARGQDDEFASRLTQDSGSGPGTPLYMAPEQIDPQTFGEISPATDVYAMGIMLYQMTSGEPPFTGSITHIFNGHLRSAPPSLHDRARGRVPEVLAEIVECALAKSPTGRFATAKAFREELLHVSTTVGVTPSPCETMPSRAAAAAISDPVMTLRAGSAAMADAGSTQLSGSSRLSPSGRRGGRQITALLVGVGVIVALAVAAWFVFSSLLKGKDESKVDEKPSVTTETAPAPAETADSAAPAAPAAPVAVPATSAPSADSDLPLGFGPSPAAEAPAPAAPTESAPAQPGGGASASDILNEHLAKTPPEPPAPDPVPPVAASVPKAQEPAKAVKSEKPKATAPAKTETTTEKSKEPATTAPAEAPATTAPADSSGGWTVISEDVHKVK